MVRRVDVLIIKAYYFFMVGFLLKKSFFDLWDNIFKIALVNIGFIVSLSLTVFIPPLFAAVPFMGIGVRLIGFLWCFVYLSAAAMSLKALSDYGSFGWLEFFGNLKTYWPAGLFLGGFVLLGYIILVMVIPFYLGMDSIMGLLAATVIFWAMVVAVLSLQFFFAVRARLDTNLFRVTRKCFIIFFDNPLFCIFSLFHNFFVLLFSALVAFLFPGPAAVFLFLDEGLRLRLLKYDWLEANPDADRRKIPWDIILIDEQEKTGSRSLISIIFPWKE